MLVGYARVSTDDQNLDLQKDALTTAACERIFEDRQSGAKADRPGLKAALDYVREGDVLVVWRLDRLSRFLKDLIELVSLLESKGIGLKSLHESIDTSSSSGKLIFHIFGALAEFERNLIRERTNAGLFKQPGPVEGRVEDQSLLMLTREHLRFVCMTKGSIQSAGVDSPRLAALFV